MAATSVTGLHKDGAGSAEPHNKGSERMTLGVDHLIGPRVVMAGEVALVAGAATVTFPQSLDESESEYVVMLCNNGNTNLATVGAKTDDGDGLFASFTIAGAGTDDIMWAVIKM